MGAEIVTKAERLPDVETASRAYELRKKGASLGKIMDITGLPDAVAVATAIKAYHAEMMIETTESKAQQIADEIARLDAVQEQMFEIMETEEWVYDKEGVALERTFDSAIKASKIILGCVKQRADLLGLTVDDTAKAQTAVIVVAGHEAEYIKGLQEAR